MGLLRRQRRHDQLISSGHVRSRRAPPELERVHNSPLAGDPHREQGHPPRDARDGCGDRMAQEELQHGCFRIRHRHRAQGRRLILFLHQGIPGQRDLPRAPVTRDGPRQPGRASGPEEQKGLRFHRIRWVRDCRCEDIPSKVRRQGPDCKIRLRNDARRASAGRPVHTRPCPGGGEGR